MKIMHFLTLSIIVAFTMNSCKDIVGGDDGTSIIKELKSIDEATILTNHRDGPDYIAKGRIDIRSKLEIEAGVEIQFEPGAYIRVLTNASISAIGTATQNILFTNTGENFASWAGIVIGSESALNNLQYCIIEHAGDGEAFGTFNQEKSAITLVGGRLRMDNCTIQKSGSNGFVTVSSIGMCTISSFENNKFIENKKFPFLVSQEYLPSMDLKSCSFIDNDRNMVGIKSDRSNRLTIQSTWIDVGIPYYVQHGFDLYEGLTIEAGVEIIFGNNAFLNVSHTNSTSPYITIQGTQSNHVVLRGEEALIGYWKGVRIDAQNVKNIFEYADISDGGSDADFSANIVLYNRNTNLTINNCTSARSGNCDVIVDDFLGLPILTNNSPEIKNVCNQ